MNVEHVMGILTPDEFSALVEAAYEEGPERQGFRVENLRNTKNQTSAIIRYQNGETREIEISKIKEHI